MKLIVGSLALNVALFAALAFKPALAPPAMRDFFARPFSATESTAGAAPRSAPAATSAPSTRLWSTLATDDLTALVARLRAAGFPPSIVRGILNAEVNARYDARIRALQETDPNVPFWKPQNNSNFFYASDTRYIEMNRLQRERSKLLRELSKDDFFATDDVSLAQRRQYGNLPRNRIDLIQRVEDDYADMIASVRAAMNGVTLPEDREKLILLNREKRADLNALLTPEELADYELRSSQLSRTLAARLATFEATEAEFRALYDAHRTLSDKFPAGFNGGGLEQVDRASLEKDFNAQLRAALGENRYADLTRALTPEFQQLSRIAERENLPSTTILQAYNLHDSVAEQSNKIFDDNSLSVDQKRAAFQALAQNTRAQITGLLGPVAGPAYVKVADAWITNVERGAAVKFPSTPPFMIFSDNGSISYGNSPTYRRLPVARPAL